MNNPISEIQITNFILPDKTTMLHFNYDDVTATYKTILTRKYNLDINDILFLYVAGQLGQKDDSNEFKPIFNIERDLGKSSSELYQEFFQNLNGGNLVEIYSQVSNANKNYFWDLYLKTKANKRVTNEQFKNFLFKQDHYEISYLRSKTTLLDIYPTEFVSILLSDYRYLPDIIDLLWPAVNLTPQTPYKFPEKHFKSSKARLHSIIKEYVQMCQSNIDKAYILGIFIGNNKVDKFFNLAPDEIDEIKKLYDKYFATLHQISYGFGCTVIRSERFEKAIVCKFNQEKETPRIIIDICPSKLKSVLKNDFESLVIRLLFYPRSMHFALSDNTKSYSVFEKIFLLTHTGEYKSSTTHHQTLIIAKCLFSEIRDIASSYSGSEFEIMLFNFINNNVMPIIAEDNVRLRNEYNPNNKSIPISTLFISIETLLKTFYLFSKHNNRKVSQQELNYIDENYDFEDIKSITPCRHITLNKDNSKATRVMDILFADLYIKDENGEYIKNLYNWIFNCGDISLLDKSDMERIDELKDAGLLEYKDNKLYCNDIQYEMLTLLKILNDESSFTFSTYRMSEAMICAIYMLQNEYKFIIPDNNLFTKSECDFLDFMLNNKKFTNSLALRNKHCHNSTYNIEDIFDDYISGLIILSFIAVTINCDLRLKDEMEENIKIIQNEINNQTAATNDQQKL